MKIKVIGDRQFQFASKRFYYWALVKAMNGSPVGQVVSNIAKWPELLGNDEPKAWINWFKKQNLIVEV
jgi:hypothetical protein